jgi:hypothetical protein
VIERCGDLADGGEDGTEERRLLAELHDEVVSCLDTAGIHRVDEVVSTGRGGSYLRAVALPAPDQQATAERCVIDARRSVLGPYVAPPSLLYLWGTPRSAGCGPTPAWDGRSSRSSRSSP